MSAIHDALVSSVYWMPFVLSIGVTYRYLKVIDISVDGIIIISGVSAAITWNLTESIVGTVAVGSVSGTLGGAFFGLLSRCFFINPLIAGIIVSLLFYSISVLLVGESLVIHHTGGIPQEWSTVPIALFVCGLLFVFVFWFYRTRLGTLIRGVSNNESLRVHVPKNVLFIAGHAISGMILGLGATIYVHWEGVARAGGGFDFLLTGLTSFLVSTRIVSIVRVFFEKENYSTESKMLRVVTSLAFQVIAGTVVFQILIYSIIYYSPYPEAWKMVLAILLAISLSRLDKNSFILRWSKYTSNATDILSCVSITKIYRTNGISQTIINDASIDFKSGLNVVIGKNGSGKSTLLKCISGEEELTKGTIQFNGSDIQSLSVHVRPVYKLNQNPSLNLAQDLLVYENIGCVIKTGIKPLDILKERSIYTMLSAKAPHFVKTMGEDVVYKKAVSLSGGEAQYLSFLMATMSDYSIVLADEPTANLDLGNRKKVIEILKEISQQKILIVVSHDNHLIREAQNIYKLKDGKIWNE